MSLITILSEYRKLDPEFVREVLTNKDDAGFVDNYDKYDNLFRIRHDYIHWTVTQERGLTFGEKRIDEIQELSELSQYENWKYIRNQTPDIIEVKGRTVNITEITVSSSRLTMKDKVTKYALMIDLMKKSGFNVYLEILAVSSNISEPGIQSLIQEHKMSHETALNIYKMVSQISKLIHMVESRQDGQEWFSRRTGESFHDVDMGISNDMILDYFTKCQNKPFKSVDDLKSFLDVNNMDGEITAEEDKFLDMVVDRAIGINSSYLKSDDFEKSRDDLYNYHIKHHNTRDKRSFFPLPFLKGLIIDSSKRNTDDDEAQFTIFKSRLLESKDSFFMKLARMSEHCGKIHLESSEKMNIALQGPGRKHYIKAGSKLHIEYQMRHKNYWYNPMEGGLDSDLNQLTYDLSNITKFDPKHPSETSGLGLDYVKCCQSIFREITINAMRSDRRHSFIFKPTGVDGVFMLLYPGAKLRTGENLSTIWFKLFTTPEKIPKDGMTTHWSFKSWKYEGDFAHTNWISIDANRLDHYLRCFDRILMAYLSYVHSGSGHIEESLVNDTSNTLGVIISIYMEDKRSTSKMLQDVRYLVMGSLSKFRWWGDLLDKFKEPLRTPLQAYLMNRVISYSEEITRNLSVYIKNFKFGKVYQQSDIISDRLAGATCELPRALTKGPLINFRQLLCEMYFTMLFNKNQDDPTHSSFQILTKMLEGEESLKQVKETTGLHLGGSSIFDDADVLINNPHKNQFSKYALIIGSKLQSKDQQNKAPAGLSHKKAAQNSFLNKPLSEFATYKSSAVYERSYYTEDIAKKKIKRKKQYADGLEEKYREGGDDTEDPDSVKFPRQNPRRRCIEGIVDLLQKGKIKSFDVIKETIMQEMFFQVFKKNQIGGAREILILPIEKRITINILESFSRLICKDDQREMLTHGDIKLSLMRDMIRDVRRTEDKKRIVLNLNLDKTRWGPSFMPIQFAYLFKPFARFYPSLFRFITLTLLVHTNKKCLIPEKLIQVWLKDRTNKTKHSEELLQKLKEKFLQTGELYFENESNMGQGILHFTSSYLHICALSFRDQIYSRMCKKLKISSGTWRDIVSSDDSYTALALPMDSVNLINQRMCLFIKAQDVTERLFNIWTSKSKSSISFLISEFNSMFGSNLTLFPTLFKFAISSVMPTNTDSFFRMVKESFNTSRQIVENGGSLELFMIAHHLNKEYCESIYHTHVGGCNDFSNFGLRREFVPYQLGVYPIENPGIMLILGPESHNYRILKNINKLNPIEDNLFRSCHNILPISNPEVYADLNSFDSIFTGLLRIEAATGPVRKLQRIKRIIDMSWEDMKKSIDADITLLLREPRDLIETKIHTYQKLFSYGASEALRDTASSIYYARVSATVTAKAFQIPYHESLSAKYMPKERRMEGYTYHDCLKFLIEHKNPNVMLDHFYPHQREYNDLYELSLTTSNYYDRNPFETQNVKTLQLTEITMRIKNPIRDLIEQFWVKPEMDKKTSFYRDWITLKELVPILDDSLQLTLENIVGDKTTQIKVLLLVLMRIMSYNNKPMKAVVYGPSTRTYDQTFLTLMQQNLMHNYTSDTFILNQNLESNPRIYDKLYYYYNIFILSHMLDHEINLDLSDLPINEYLRDNFIQRTSKKKIMMMLMYQGYLDNYSDWTDQTKTIMHHWIQRQFFDKKTSEWRGNFKLKAQCGKSKMILQRIGKKHHITVSELSNPTLNFELLKYCAELVQSTPEEIIKTINKGRFIIINERIHPVLDMVGFHVETNTIDDLMIDVGQLIIREEKDHKFICLFDDEQNPILKTPMGLLPTDYIPLNGDFDDFTIDGLSIYELSNIRIFSAHFNFDDLNPVKAISILNDLNVERPKISTITKERLSGVISPEWETKDVFDYFEEAVFEDDPLDILTRNVEVTAEDVKFAMDQKFDDPYDAMLDPGLSWDLISNLPMVRPTFVPQRILERVLTAKYHLIAMSCTDLKLLNKLTIRMIYSQTMNMNIIYSLVFLYDKMFMNTTAPSPVIGTSTMRREFVEKFDLFNINSEMNLM